MDELEEDRNEVELMIDFYEHRLAHGCLLKGLGTKGRGTDDGGPVRPKGEETLLQLMINQFYDSPETLLAGP